VVPPHCLLEERCAAQRLPAMHCSKQAQAAAVTAQPALLHL